MRGLYLATSLDGAELDDKRFWDVYAKCEEIAGRSSCIPSYTDRRRAHAALLPAQLSAIPTTPGMAAACLIFGGVLGRIPEARGEPAASRAGRCPGLIGALDHGHEGARGAEAHEAPAERIPAALHLRHIGHDDRINMNLVRQVGADRVILGSDYCFDMGLDDPVATVARMSELTQEERDLILGRTARKLLRIE
jgi:aminocarboxymuconate-semialdehyde decarboxylase